MSNYSKPDTSIKSGHAKSGLPSHVRLVSAPVECLNAETRIGDRVRVPRGIGVVQRFFGNTFDRVLQHFVTVRLESGVSVTYRIHSMKGQL